ncbi:MAG: TadE/TadG family type IV pilus assembly protein, partial [Bryobacteraceae bacterium]
MMMGILAKFRIIRRRLGRPVSGQSLIETALVFPMLVTMLIGAADLAQV